MDQEHIDSLLERYLALLDEYTQLRDRLSRLQSGVYQGIARANFSAERGLRYGQDQYDDRMQASRRLDIGGEREDGTTAAAYAFSVLDLNKEPTDSGEEEEEEESEEADSEEESENSTAAKDGGQATGDGEKEQEDHPGQAGEKEEEAEKNQQRKATPLYPNPLRWFGILAPMPLRNAQTLSVEVVEEVIPRLVSVNAAMADLEIEVRRARKKRAKAAEKTKESGKSPEDTTKGSKVAKPVSV